MSEWLNWIEMNWRHSSKRFTAFIVLEYDLKNYLSNLSMIITIALWTAAAAAKSLQSCPTLCNHIDGSLPGAFILGILQERILEWVDISFSSTWNWQVKMKSLSPVDSLGTHGQQPIRCLCPWDFPSMSTGVGCHCIPLSLMRAIQWKCRKWWYW